MPVKVVDAPSNLGLRPPLEGSVPGCYKAGWALRNAGLLTGLNVSNGGTVIPPRYEAAWTPGDGDRNADAIAAYSYALADHLERFVAGSDPVFVIGGDCSILIGECLALRRRGRYGLVFIDGHSDFRHPGNSSPIGTAAGEDLAIVTNRGDPRLTNLDGLGALIDERDIVVVGTRPDDEHASELKALGVPVWSVPGIRQAGPELPDLISNHFDLESLNGIWIHVDIDVVDPTIIPAVDTPTPGGLTLEELSTLLEQLPERLPIVGIDLCIYDPDLDADGEQARLLAQHLRGPLTRLSV